MWYFILWLLFGFLSALYIAHLRYDVKLDDIFLCVVVSIFGPAVLIAYILTHKLDNLCKNS